MKLLTNGQLSFPFASNALPDESAPALHIGVLLAFPFHSAMRSSELVNTAAARVTEGIDAPMNRLTLELGGGCIVSIVRPHRSWLADALTCGHLWSGSKACGGAIALNSFADGLPGVSSSSPSSFNTALTSIRGNSMSFGL